MKRTRYMSLLTLAAVFLTGCASMHSSRSGGLVEGIKHKCEAQQAWNAWSWCYAELNHPFHFARGFKAAYRDVREGGKGCQPTLPPKCYWKSRYQSAEGRCKVNAWFEGYSHGALAAQQDGVGHWNEIPISPTARINLQMQNLQPASHGSGYSSPSPGEAPALPSALPGTEHRRNRGGNSDDAVTQKEDAERVPVRPYE